MLSTNGSIVEAWLRCEIFLILVTSRFFARRLPARLANLNPPCIPGHSKSPSATRSLHMGFPTNHVGGNKAPGGYGDASLGPVGYRVMLECKTGKGNVTQPTPRRI